MTLRQPSLALPVTYVLLRILVVLNWLGGAAVLALLTATIVAEAWTFKALGIAPSSWIAQTMNGLRLVAALGLASVPLNHVVLTRLIGIVTTVRTGDPFVAANYYRLRLIAWCLLGLQLLGMAIGGIGEAISTPENPVHFDAGFSVNGWLAVLLTFVLARIFAEGSLMREDLEGTI